MDSTKSRVEWNAEVYHRISEPQYAWGLSVLSRLSLQGNETVMDAGCGSGRLTAELCRRLPEGRVIAVDRSENMVEEARRTLEPAFGNRVTFRSADLQTLAAQEQVDIIFSTATFHWIGDHPKLFRHLFESLKPSGWLIAQCGGKGNLNRIHARGSALMSSPKIARYYQDWIEPWEFASAETTAQRLEDAGFTQVETSLVPAPATFPSAEAFEEFITHVVLRLHLLKLPSDEAKADFTAALVEQAAQDEVPYTLDYIRLNMKAQKP